MKHFLLVCIVAACGAAADGATLQIGRQAGGVQLRWPTNGADSRVQFAPHVAPSNGWQTLLLQHQTNGANYELNLFGGDPARFFRLLQPGNAAPALTLLNPPASMLAGSSSNLAFSYADVDGDLVLLEVTRSNVDGTKTSAFPTALLGLGGTNGTGSFSVKGAQLPFGPTEYQLRLIDSRGNASPVATWTVNVVGPSTGGTAPVLNFVTAGEPTSYTRPSGQFDRFKPALPVTFSDPDGDLFRVRIVLVNPGNQTNVLDESAAALGMSGSNGTVRIPFFSFGLTNLLGSYTVTLTGTDRNGNVGPPASRTIGLTSFSVQALGLRLTSFTPTYGPPGTVVVLNGSFFEQAATNNFVRLNHLEVPVLNFSNNVLSVIVPEGAETGPFIVRKPNGAVAITPTRFVVPPSVRVLTESDPGTNEFTEAFTLAPGASLRLRAQVSPLTPGGDRSVDWSASAGTITADGVFTAPPTNGLVTVLAALRAAPTNTGALELRISQSQPFQLALRSAKNLRSPTSIAGGPPPIITSLEPNSFREGDLAPIRLSGSGLAGDLQVQILDGNGMPATNISALSYLGFETNAGVLIEVGSILEFDSGTRTFSLRVTAPGGAFAQQNFTVEGLPELHVPPGGSVEFNNSPPLLVSGVRVESGGRIGVPRGKLEIESTGDVIIDGHIDAAGQPGEPASIQQPGAPGPLSHGGRGGLGREDSEGFLGLDGAEPENYGLNANDALGFSRPEQGPSRPFAARDRFPQGIGGGPGSNLEIDPADIIEKVVECVGSLGTVCIHAAIELIEQTRSVVEIAEGGGPGRRGYGAVQDSDLDATGGGGGGGGGRIDVTVSVPFGPDLAGVNIIGGGGGGGGDGGRNVLISTPRAILLGNNGLISTAGGNGGDASSVSHMDAGLLGFFVRLPFPSPCLPGGGGGGGRGGNIALTGGLGVQRDSPDQFQNHGGQGGVGGAAYLEPENRVSRYQLASMQDANGPTGRRFINGPFLDPATYRPKVTSRLLLALTGVDTVVQRGTHGGYQIVPMRVRVTGATQSEDFVLRYNELTRRYEGYLLLYNGFNALSGTRLFPQRMLVLATDADNDRLSDDDEADLGTNPNAPDTDGDSITDGRELVAGGNPLRPDTDGDGLLDGAELARGTRLDRRDTDGDGFWDSTEVLAATNPLDPASKPAELAEGTMLSSASHVSTTGGAYLAAINHLNGQFGLFGRPAGGLGFGLAMDHTATLLIADGPWLRAYDPIAQTAATVGEFDTAAHDIECATLTFNPVDKFLYGVELGGAPDYANTGQLLRINRLTGAATRIGVPLPQRIRALACNTSGNLLAALEDAPISDLLVELDPATGAQTRIIGPLGFAPINGLAFNRLNQLFGVIPQGEDSRLLSINATNGAAAPTVTVARSLWGLTFVPCPAPCLAFAGASPGWFFPNKLKSVDYDGDNREDLVLLAARDGANTGSSVTFLRSQGNGLFLRDTNYTLSTTANQFPGDHLAVARLNADLLPDIVAKNPFASPATVATLLNSGGGAFAPPLDVPTGLEAKSFAVGDVTGDTVPDLAMAGAGELLVLRGDGIGGFGNAYTPFTPAPEWFMLEARLGDVDADGDLDLVALDSAAILVSLNNGSGSFGTPVPTIFAYEDNGVELADMNNDGRDDVVVMLAGQTGGFFVLFSQGGGQLSAPVFTTFANIATFPSPQDFTLADLNDDALPDLVFAEYSSAAVHIWFNQGDGAFRPRRKGPLPTQSGRPPLTVAVGDFNHDGKPDIAAGVLMLNQVWTWMSQ